MDNDILELAKAQIKAKQEEEIKHLERKYNADIETIQEALKLIKEHTLYKKVPSGYNSCRYVLATEEMLKHDYVNEPNKAYYSRGIKFKNKIDESRWYNTGLLEVNGETYYDIRWALQNYEKSVKDKESQVSYLQDKITDLKKELEQMHKDFPSLKQAIEEWQAYVKEKETQWE